VGGARPRRGHSAPSRAPARARRAAPRARGAMSAAPAGASFYAAQGSAGGAAAAEHQLPRALLRKLEVLSYPNLGTASLSGDEYCKIVLWLEEEKIRFYEPKSRKALREFGEAWFGHVAKYAKELNVPADNFSDKDSTAKLRVLSGLANLAIHDVYRDKVEAKEVVLAAPAKPVAGAESKQKLQDLVPALNKLLELYALPKLQPDAIDTDTVAALRCIKTRMCQKGKGSVSVDLGEMPIAVEVDDPEVRKAAGVLRLLHNVELGQLQISVNHVLNELQQLTANPRTDSRLGRVGT